MVDPDSTAVAGAWLEVGGGIEGEVSIGGLNKGRQ